MNNACVLYLLLGESISMYTKRTPLTSRQSIKPLGLTNEWEEKG
jgi:hypothetical protein